MSDTADTPKHTPNTGGEVTLNSPPNRVRAWFMTWNSYPDNWKTILDTQTQKWKGQLEEGASGNRHIQASLYFQNGKTFAQVKKLFPGAHLEPTIAPKQADLYCTKEDTRVTNTDYFRARHMVMYRWQAEILDIVAGEPHDRRIHWYWSEAGGVGKSVFVRHLCLRHKALMVDGCGRDILHAVAEFGNPGVIVFDLPRKALVDYRVLEAVKNGLFFSGKYESKMVTLDYPHIFVFANFPPKENELSADRWWIRQLDSLDTSGDEANP